MRAIRILVVVLLLIVVGGLALRVSGGDFGVGRGPVIQPGSALVLDLEGEYVEAPEAPLLARVLGQHRVPLVSVLSELRKAGRDARISTVVLRIRGLDGAEIEAKVAARREARESKDFARADALRKELLELGVELQDGEATSTFRVLL